MPIIGDRVEIERKPKLGGGGPGKIPHRRGYGGGDDGDHGNAGDFRSREQRMRRYRIGMTLCILSVTSIFVLLTMVYVFRMGKGRLMKMPIVGSGIGSPLPFPICNYGRIPWSCCSAALPLSWRAARWQKKRSSPPWASFLRV